jgi:hypothetical protein
MFIWPHVGFGSAQQVAAVLSNHPNVFATLSKKDTNGANFADADRAEVVGDSILDGCGAVKPEWLALMRQFSRRLMFATDAHKTYRWAGYANIVARWRYRYLVSFRPISPPRLRSEMRRGSMVCRSYAWIIAGWRAPSAAEICRPALS